ncbi:hypothetical protein [Methylobacterium soli]|uniref:hypothetical protein n=1 Tax=Methylobacterium soli TaxID=553447 RepID=UPI001FCF7D3E|nr:hypothetical protein [Methylobacterium soli]GJE41441.1 hypothetical protein AEGHOMDF_0607 [Methylobacterium soli]
MSQADHPPAASRLKARPSGLVRSGLLALLATAALGGCQAFGGGGGVMPASDLGPPPSLRGSLSNREVRTATTDPDGQPLQTAPTRRLDLPKNARGEARAAEAGPRRIQREEIEGAAAAGSSSGGLAPSLSASGGVGVGGKF